MSTSGNLFSGAWKTIKETFTAKFDPTFGASSVMAGRPSDEGVEGGVRRGDGSFEKFPMHPAAALVAAPVGLATATVQATAGLVAAGLEAVAGDGKAPAQPSYSNSVTPEESAALEAKLSAGNPEKKGAQQMTTVAPDQSAADKEKARKEAGTPDYTVAV
jgi:hypothetical protein